jgi:hypothetical protein
LVHFLGLFHGVIDEYSMSAPLSSAEWKARISTGDVVQARIVFIDHGTKSVRLSLRPHILDFKGPSNLPALG